MITVDLQEIFELGQAVQVIITDRQDISVGTTGVVIDSHPEPGSLLDFLISKGKTKVRMCYHVIFKENPQIVCCDESTLGPVLRKDEIGSKNEFDTLVGKVL